MLEPREYDELATRVRAAARGAHAALEVGSALQGAAGDVSDDPIAPLILAFNYDLVSPRNEERRAEHGAFAPMVEWDGHQFPPPLGSIEDEPLTIWAEVADRSDTPIVVARLNDLLWERKFGDRPDKRARAAIDAYLEMRESAEPMVAADALVRALELTRALNDQERAAEISALILEHVDASLETAEPGPGEPLTLLEALIDLPSDERPEALDEYLNRVKERYGDDPFIVEATTELQAALHRDDPDGQRALHAEAVERFRAEAGRTAGILRLAHLQHALELARQHGLRDELEELRREIQDIHPDELDLKEMSAEVTVPTEHVERLVEVITAGADWSECLARFAIIPGPPSGSHEKNLEFIQKLKAQSPLMFIIPRAELGPEGMTVRELRTEKEHLEGALADHERTSIAIWSLIASKALDHILERHGEPTEEELASFLESESIPQDLAEQLAHGISLFTSGSYDDSAHALAPRIERAVRELCRQAGLVVVREPIGGEPGGVRPLGHLLAALQGILDESWRRYLVNALTEPLGMNLRNRIAHGLIGVATRHDAALLVHVAAFLRTLEVKRPD